MPEQNDDSKLRPCPFCGRTGLLQIDEMVNETSDEIAGQLAEEEIEQDEWFVVCGDCAAMGPLSPSRAQARRAWNMRAEGNG